MGLKSKIFIVFLILTVAGVYHFCQQSKFENLKTNHKFRIYRDQNGLPRIFARDKLSTYYALGFAEAEGRLWTIHLKRIILQGRLSQIFGPEALAVDFENRNFDFYGIGKINQKGLKKQQRKLLQAYCDGINDYAKNVNFLPFEFYLTFSKWQQFNITDVLGMIPLLSFSLQFDWMYQLARQRLLETVGFDLAWKLIAFGDDNLFRQITIMTNDQIKQQKRYQMYDSRIIQRVLKEHWVNKTMPIGSIRLPQTQYEGVGSNAWVIGGEHTTHGKPILANDPHLGLLIPSLFSWFEFNIVDQNNELKQTAFGVKVDGIPALSLGLNNKFAWGSTAAYIDNKDVFHEVVRDNNGSLQYLFNQTWHPFIKRKQVFKVRGKGQFVKYYYHTHRGPVIEDLFDQIHVKYGFPISTHYKINHTLTFSSSMYVPDYDSIEGLCGLSFSQNFQQFEKFSSLIATPNIDSVFITDNGTYGYGSVGRIPKRKIPQMGGFVKDGTTDIYDMGQFLNWTEMPKLRMPKKGYVAMANNKFAEDSYDTRSSIHQITTGRAYRLQQIITQKIKKGHKFTFDDMKDMQLDLKDQYLSEAFPYLLKGINSVRHIWSNKQTDKYFDLLSKWDYFMPPSSIQASIYHVFEHHFHQSLLHGTALSSQQRQAILNHAFFQVYYMKLHQRIGHFNLTQQQAFLCSNTQNSNYTQIHPCLVNAALTFKKLPQLLFQLFQTKNHEQYEWGKIHKHKFKAVPWSDIPLLSKIWGREVPAGGNSRTLNVAILTHQLKSYNSVAGAVVRFITDLNETYYSIDTGLTDRVTDKFYDNFLGKDKYIKYTKHNPIKGEKVNWKLIIDRI